MTADHRPTDASALVTGGAGFVGSHLARALLDRGNDVTVIDDCSSGDAARVPDGAAFVEGDVRDRATLSDVLEGVDLVFHQAALASVDRSVEAPAESHSRNATGTLRLLDAARRHGVDRVVLASSAAIYGQPEYVPIDETHPTEPTSPYGLDKLATDHYGRIFHDLYGLETVPLRYFNVYGPGQSDEYAAVVAVFRDQALADEPITVEGDGSQTRDFVHVDDVVAANLRAATCDARHCGRAYNVGTGQTVTVRELAELTREIAGADSDIVHVDPREGDVAESVADVSAARERLGYEPTVTLEDGLRDVLESDA